MIQEYMVMKKCNYCQNDVPDYGQCNKCGFIDGMSRQPTDAEFKRAREINIQNNYPQYKNLDMLLID